MIDDEHFDGALGRLELQPELVHRSEDKGEVGAVKLAMSYLGMALRAVAARPEFLDPVVIDNDLLLGRKLDLADAGTPVQGETS